MEACVDCCAVYETSLCDVVAVEGAVADLPAGVVVTIPLITLLTLTITAIPHPIDIHMIYLTTHHITRPRLHIPMEPLPTLTERIVDIIDRIGQFTAI